MKNNNKKWYNQSVYVYITLERGQDSINKFEVKLFSLAFLVVICKALSRGWGQQTKSVKDKLKKKLDKAKTRVKNERRGRLAERLRRSKEEEKEEEGVTSAMAGFVF